MNGGAFTLAFGSGFGCGYHIRLLVEGRQYDSPSGSR